MTSPTEGNRNRAPSPAEAPATRPANLYQKLAAISGELGAITKDSQAPAEMGGFRFMSHGALMGHLREKLAERQVAILESLAIVSDDVVMMKTQSGERANRRIVVELLAVFVNAEDPQDRCEVKWFGEGLDTRDKALQKAATSAEKYLLSKTFKVSDKDDPDGSESAGELATQPATPAQQRRKLLRGWADQPDETPPPAAEEQDARQPMTMAQQIAMICRNVGIERSNLIYAVTGKERGRDLTREEAEEVLSQAKFIERGSAALREVDGEWSVLALDQAQPSQLGILDGGAPA